jgi:hypothetical protein
MINLFHQEGKTISKGAKNSNNLVTIKLIDFRKGKFVPYFYSLLFNGQKSFHSGAYSPE